MKQTVMEWLKILFTPRKEIQYFKMKMRIKHILLMIEEEKNKNNENSSRTNI